MHYGTYLNDCNKQKWPPFFQLGISFHCWISTQVERYRSDPGNNACSRSRLLTLNNMDNDLQHHKIWCYPLGQRPWYHITRKRIKTSLNIFDTTNRQASVPSQASFDNPACRTLPAHFMPLESRRHGLGRVP